MQKQRKRKRTKIPMVNFFVRLPPEIIALLRERSRNEGRSMSALVRESVIDDMGREIFGRTRSKRKDKDLH